MKPVANNVRRVCRLHFFDSFAWRQVSRLFFFDEWFPMIYMGRVLLSLRFGLGRLTPLNNFIETLNIAIHCFNPYPVWPMPLSRLEKLQLRLVWFHPPLRTTLLPSFFSLSDLHPNFWARTATVGKPASALQISHHVIQNITIVERCVSFFYAALMCNAK